MGTAGDCGIARSRPKEGAEDGGDAQQTEVSTWTVAPDRCEKAVEGSRKSCGAADAAIVLVRRPPKSVARERYASVLQCKHTAGAVGGAT